MKTKIILRLLKVIVFVSVVTFHGFTSGIGIKSQILFAIALAMYLIELYKGEKCQNSKR